MQYKWAVWIIQGVTLVIMLNTVSGAWCDLDTGYTTITDGRGYPHNVFISVTRDGGVWVRAGLDFMNDDWIYRDEWSHRYQVMILDQQTSAMLPSLNYTHFCVQTDLDLAIKMNQAWHPSFIKVYVPGKKVEETIQFRQQAKCVFNTSLSVSGDKQGLACEGGIRNVCGMNNLPHKDYVSHTVFLRHLSFDPEGLDHFRCGERKETSSYTLLGSYYHVYVKVAVCNKPRDARMLGHESKLRPHIDVDRNMAIIPDSSQTALASGVIIGWHVYAKVISFQHHVYLQVWRPHAMNKNLYTLISQTLFQPSKLRFMEIPLHPRNYTHIRRGDVLGLYYSMHNPLPYSTTPCALPEQHLKRLVFSQRELHVGHAYGFQSVASGPGACRQYSFTADLANKSDAKMVEDWHCPSPKTGYMDKESQVGSRTKAGSGSNNDSPGGATKKPVLNGGKKQAKRDPSDMVLPIHYILAIIGGLLVLMVFIGGISYYRAIKSD